MSISGIGGGNFPLQGGSPLSLQGSPHITKLSAKQVAALDKALNPAPPQREADNSPEKLYAEITVNGKVVAKVWETGIVGLPNAHAGLADRLSDSGANLAQERTQQIAEALGGTIHYTDNARQARSYTFSESLAQLMSR
ncbi:hypothetical protein EQG41_09305 [Billgrantia azerbaijanica]|nr:hypothetical protein EQG41_09305 [Halomonas azerbaijanica]